MAIGTTGTGIHKIAISGLKRLRRPANGYTADLPWTFSDSFARGPLYSFSDVRGACGATGRHEERSDSAMALKRLEVRVGATGRDSRKSSKQATRGMGRPGAANSTQPRKAGCGWPDGGAKPSALMGAFLSGQSLAKCPNLWQLKQGPRALSARGFLQSAAMRPLSPQFTQLMSAL